MIKQNFIKREIMNLLLTYQNELLALLAVIVVIFIYFIFQKNKTSNNDNDKEKKIEAKKAEASSLLSKENLKQEEEKTEKDEIEKIEQKKFPSEEDFKLDGSQEGEFFIEEETEKVEEKGKQQTKIIKRDIPPHEKITKEDFKEFAGSRILVAEDNIINQKVILGLLADSGIEVIIANDGVETLEILEQDNNFTLILMDAHMPNMDGFEATRKIRENSNFSHIAIIALSGDTAADDVRKMHEAGMIEHLEKPLKIDALYDMLYAYTPQKNDNFSENFNELNIEEGLEISGNDQAFYNEILSEFLSTYKQSHLQIDNYLKQNNIKAADQLLLDIIGVSANIGADSLYKSAQNLKASLASNDNKRSRLIFNFKETLEKLIKEIQNYLP